MSLRLEVQLDRESYRAGEAVTGTVLVLEGGSSRALEATLEFKEKSSDYDATPRKVGPQRLHEGDLATGESYELAVELPQDALPSLKSEHGELYWELDVRSDERGPDTHERRRIEVVGAD